jgi:anaerobic selenocysteine-containing dehydrogenase/Fe-S-cluster-containing dehydrogenase component
MTDGMNRRRFLKVLGATGGGAAVLSGCGIGPEPVQEFHQYVVPPEDQTPGLPTWYASTCRECAAGCGIRVKVREGRAIKIEGNPDSPINRGRLCARGQAALQGLYNPDRLTEPLQRNAAGQLEATTWDRAIGLLQAKVEQARGKDVVFVTGLESGSFGDLVDEWMRTVGGRHVTYEPFAFEALREGNRLTFDDASLPTYDFANASYVVSFGADFMETWLSPVGFQNAFSRAHSFASGRDASMAKFVFVGPRLSQTGIVADEWINIPPGAEGLLALGMARAIVDRRSTALPADAARLPLPDVATVAKALGLDPSLIDRLAGEFAAAGAPLAVAGGTASQDPGARDTVVAVNLLNYVAGAIGRTVRFGADLAAGGSGTFREMVALTGDLAAGRVGLILVHGANPMYSLGGAFAQAWAKAGFKVAFATCLDETAAAADLVLPDLHPLEQWNDSRPRAGVYALQQPAMLPVFDGPTAAGDILLRVAGKTGGFKEYLRTQWQALQGRIGTGRGTSFEDWWNGALQHGGMYGDAPTRAVRLAPRAAQAIPTSIAVAATELSAVVFPHSALLDGRGANKSWLQELPDPVSKITWHGWVEVNPATAARWEVTDGDIVLVKSSAGALRAPVWVTPSVRPGVVALPTGQGHTAYGRYAQDRSFNAFELLPGDPTAYGGRSFTVPVTVQRTGEHRFLSSAAGDPRTLGEAEDIVKLLPLAQAQALTPGQHPFAEEETPPYADQALEGWAEAQHEKAMLGNYAGDHPRWAMAIDLQKCTGCSACVTACYAENNLATVGEELFMRHRQMSWMRIERYWRGGDGTESVRGVVQPMLCQQCEQAPCEPVCPVFAAYHTVDGLNGQVYNRCVGTRYCSNNCPYKVRYFNWLNYAEPGGRWEAWPEPLNWQLNPDVTVREKGVMEKCTFCIQRIRATQNQARLEDRQVRDGEIVPACAQTCPSEAIVFGDLHDPASQVSQLAQHPRGYHVLEGLNTKPGITYLARVVNAGEA